jgi:hypothetical protein
MVIILIYRTALKTKKRILTATEYPEFDSVRKGQETTDLTSRDLTSNFSDVTTIAVSNVCIIFLDLHNAKHLQRIKVREQIRHAHQRSCINKLIVFSPTWLRANI